MEKKKNRPNVFDILIIIAVLGMCVSLAVRGGYISSLVIGDTRDLSYTIEISAFDSDYDSALAEGINVYFNGSVISAGKITKVVADTATVSVVTPGGSTVIGTLAGKSDATVTISVEAVVKDDKIYCMDGTQLEKDADAKVTIGGVAFSGKIERIEFNE